MPPAKMATSQCPKPVNTLPYMAERTLQMGLRILRCRDFPGLSSWVQGDHKSAYKREAEGSESESSLCSLKSTQVMMEEVIGTIATELVSCSQLPPDSMARRKVAFSPSVTIAIFNTPPHVILVCLSAIHLYLNF